MKRIGALLLALLLIASCAFAEVTITQEAEVGGLVIWRNHEEIKDENREIVMDYPTFERCAASVVFDRKYHGAYLCVGVCGGSQRARRLLCLCGF